MAMVPAFKFSRARPIIVPTVPGAPTGISASPGDTTITVSFSPPASNGGSPITSYLATAQLGGQTKSGSGSPLVLTGMTNGVADTVKVHAINAIGAGPDSVASNSVTPSPSAVAVLGPGAAWTGTAGSGFDGSHPAPVDPTRTTAKPALRTTGVWGQRISGSLFRIIVDSDAAGLSSGTDFGIQSLTGYVEGNSANLGVETVIPDTDTNGNTTRTIGYYLDVDVGACLAVTSAGAIQVYFKSIANDASMQARVIGPYEFYPRSTAVDHKYTIGPSGADFTDLKSALTAARTGNGGSPWEVANFEFQTTGTYPLVSETVLSNLWLQKGQWTITAKAGVTATLGVATFPAGLDVFQAAWDPKLEGLCFRGSGIVIDMRNISVLAQTGNTGPDGKTRPNWFDGCKITNSIGTNTSYYYNGAPKKGIFFAPAFCTDMTMEWVASPWVNKALVRNCRALGVLYEAFSGTSYVAYNYINNYNANFWFWDQPALNISYSGAGTMEVEVIGSGETAGRTFAIKINGSTVFGPITLGFFTTDTYFAWSAIVSAVNAAAISGLSISQSATPSQRAASTSGFFWPRANSGINTTVNATFPLPGTEGGVEGVGSTQFVIHNTGAQTLFYAMNANATITDTPILAGASAVVTRASNTYFTAVTATGSTSLSYNAVVGSTTMQMGSYCDFHQDGWHSVNAGVAIENTILRGNTIIGVVYTSTDGGMSFTNAQGVTSVRLDSPPRDLMIFNNSWYIADMVGTSPTGSHIYMRAESYSQEGWTPGNVDAYSRITDCVSSLFWQGSPITAPAFINNYVNTQVPYTQTTALASAPNSGNDIFLFNGDYAAQKAASNALFTDAFNGNYTGASGQGLTTTQKVRKSKYDAFGRPYDPTGDYAGAVSKNTSAPTWPF